MVEKLVFQAHGQYDFLQEALRGDFGAIEANMFYGWRPRRHLRVWLALARAHTGALETASTRLAECHRIRCCRGAWTAWVRQSDRRQLLRRLLVR